VSTGFSLRARRPDGALTSFAYGVSAESANDGNAHLQFFFREFSSADNPQTIRDQLLEAAPFKASGQYTLDLALDSENIGYANRVLPLLWDAAATVSQTPSHQ